MNTDALITAVQTYFAGERHEGFAVLGFLVALVIVAGTLHAVGRDGFSRGFGIVALLLAILMSPIGVSLMRRDARHQPMLVAGLRGEDARAVVSAEAGRMAASRAKPMDNTDFDVYWRKEVVAEFVGYALRELRGDDMTPVRLRIARRTLQG